MGFGFLVLVMGSVICAYGMYMCERGRKADRARRHARFHRVPR